jgi:hypothetical protein
MQLTLIKHRLLFMHQKLLLIFFVFIFLADQSFASHAAGGSISLTKTNNPDEYLVRLRLYRNCSSITYGTLQNIWARSLTTGLVTGCSAYLVSSALVDSSDCIPLSGFNCTVGIGIEELIYEGYINLLPAVDWIVYYTECCRNFAINNLISAPAYDIYIEATVDNLNFPGNSTPDFIKTPSLYECSNYSVSYINPIFEPDSDMVLYSLIGARSSATSYIPYVVSLYNPLDFLHSSAAISIDSLAGTISFTPDYIGAFVAVIKATEFRNGIESGSTMRDIIINVINGTSTDIQKENTRQIELLPNPVVNELFLDNAGQKISSIKIFNSFGEVVINETTASGKIDVSNLKCGLYLLQCENKEAQYISRFIKM